MAVMYKFYTYNGSNAQTFLGSNPGRHQEITRQYKLEIIAFIRQQHQGLSIDVQSASNSDGGNVQIYSTKRYTGAPRMEKLFLTENGII